MELPEYIYQHTIIIEPFLSNTSHGPAYGPSVSYRCFIDDTTTLQLNTEGKEVVSNSRVIAPLDSNIPIESRSITLFIKLDLFNSLSTVAQDALKVGGRKSLVFDVKRRDGGDLPLPHHLEVILR